MSDKNIKRIQKKVNKALAREELPDVAIVLGSTLDSVIRDLPVDSKDALLTDMIRHYETMLSAGGFH